LNYFELGSTKSDNLMRKAHSVVVAVTLFIFSIQSCKKEKLSPEKAIQSFAFKVQDNDSSIAADMDAVINDDSIVIEMIPGTTVTHLVPSITFTGKNISPANGTPQDFSRPVNYSVTADDGSIITYTVVVRFVPTIYIGDGNGNIDAINAQTGKAFWSYLFEGVIQSSPTVFNGTVYIGVDFSLLALDAVTGKKKWIMTSAKNEITSTPTVVNGVLYVTSWDGNLYAVDPNTGTVNWVATTGNLIRTSPTVENGVVYFGNDNGDLYAIDASNGSLKWAYSTLSYLTSSPTVANGVVYEGGEDGFLYAIDAQTGAVDWTVLTYAIIDASPTMYNSTVYVGCDDYSFVGSPNNKVFAVDALTGNVKWTLTMDNTLYSSPSVDQSTLYQGCVDGKLYAIDTVSGHVVWTVATQGWIKSSPLVAKGKVYFASYDGSLYAVDAGSGKQEWTVNLCAPNPIDSSPCMLDTDGTIFHPGISGDHP